MDSAPALPASTGLPSLGELISSSWHTYISSWKKFIWLIIWPILATLAVVVVIGIIIATILSVTGGELTPDRIAFLVPPALVGLIAVMIINSLGKLAFIKAIDLEGQASTRDLIGQSWPLVGKYIILQSLLGLTILFGFVLLVIPGLIFSVWFMFSTFILAIEGVGVRAAMKQSRAYVKGKFWGITGRMLMLIIVIGALTAAASYVDNQIVTIIVQVLSTFLLAPLATICTFKLYESAKATFQ